MSAALDEVAMSTMTDEELEAIRDDDETSTTTAEADNADGDDDTGDDDTKAGAATDAGAQGKASAVGSPPPSAGAADAGVTSEPDPVAPAPAAVETTYRAEKPADYDAQAEAIKTERKSLTERFKAGEIEIDEYEAEVEKLDQKREDLLVARVKSEVASESSEQAAAARWQAAIESLFEQAKQGAAPIDYRADAAKANDLDMFVRAIAANPANEKMGMAGWLAEADRRVRALHGLVSPDAPPQKSKQDVLKEHRESRKPPMDAVPKTIADVPGGDGPGDVGSEFADLDNLDGEELEAALARLTPAKRAAYAAGK